MECGGGRQPLSRGSISVRISRPRFPPNQKRRFTHTPPLHFKVRLCVKRHPDDDSRRGSPPVNDRLQCSQATQGVAKMHTLCYVCCMKPYDWNDEKNECLRKERGLTFEDVVFHLAHGGLLDTIEHPNQRQYPGQRIFIVDVEGYACLVPFVENDEVIFLKTVIPSRKMTRQYLGGDSE